jgi:hypothetical protein
VRCQSEALAHHASTLAAARRAVNRKSDLNELRAEIAALRALVAAKLKREPSATARSPTWKSDRVSAALGRVLINAQMSGFGDEAEMRGR